MIALDIRIPGHLRLRHPVRRALCALAQMPTECRADDMADSLRLAAERWERAALEMRRAAAELTAERADHQ